MLYPLPLIPSLSQRYELVDYSTIPRWSNCSLARVKNLHPQPTESIPWVSHRVSDMFPSTLRFLAHGNPTDSLDSAFNGSCLVILSLIGRCLARVACLDLVSRFLSLTWPLFTPGPPYWCHDQGRVGIHASPISRPMLLHTEISLLPCGCAPRTPSAHARRREDTKIPSVRIPRGNHSLLTLG